MLKLLRSLRRDEQGVSTVEYAVLAVGVALVIMTGATYLGGNINKAMFDIASTLTGAV
jgi:Flp pilus assembly pilin Flp